MAVSTRPHTGFRLAAMDMTVEVASGDVDVALGVGLGLVFCGGESLSLLVLRCQYIALSRKVERAGFG